MLLWDGYPAKQQRAPLQILWRIRLPGRPHPRLRAALIMALSTPRRYRWDELASPRQGKIPLP